jgi:5-methylcytosine-specific restriction protein A
MDHIIPTAEGGTDAEENLQVLCQPCHARKTAQEGVRGRARKRSGGDPLVW